MGLREKVALATVAVIAAQILCSHCMPRSLPRYSVKSHINSLISPKTDSIREFKTNRKLRKNSYNNNLNGNSSKVFHLPNGKEPSEFETDGYYRFYCDYAHQPKKLPETKFQIRNFKRETKHKRYPDLSHRDKSHRPIKNSCLASEPRPQPYCFRNSSFFPEVEYPLSARDMWIPKYWSRLLDAEVPRNVKTHVPINQNEPKNTISIYPSYENSPLYDIIKTLNNHNKDDTDNIDDSNLEEFIPSKSEDKSKPKEIHPSQNLNTLITILPENTIPTRDTTPVIDNDIQPYSKTTTKEYPVPEADSVLSVVPPVTRTTPMEPNIPATIASVTNLDLRNSDFDIVGATTILPYDDFTTPITPSKALAENFTLLPITVTSMQAQEREASLSETNIEPTTTPTTLPLFTSTTPKLVSFISSTENNIEQQSRDHTTPIQSTTISAIKSSNVIHSNLDKILSTAPVSDLLTSPVSQSIASANNILSVPTTTASIQTQEREASQFETNTEYSVSPKMLSLIPSEQKIPEQQSRDGTTPMQPTTLSSKKSSDAIHSDFDKIGVSPVLISDLFTSPITQSITPADIFFSLPTTIASMQAQERDSPPSEINIEANSTEQVHFNSSTDKGPEQHLSDHSTPIQSTTLSPMRSRDSIHSKFDEIGTSTASPSYLLTSPVPQSITSADNFMSLPTTLASLQKQELEAAVSESDAVSMATPKLMSLIYSTEKISEHQLEHRTTPMQSTTLSPMKSSDTDEIGVSKISLPDLFYSPMTTLIPSTNNFISLPTTVAPLQTQEREKFKSESNIEPPAAPENALREQELSDQATTQISDKNSNSGNIHVTVSPFDDFKSSITHLESLPGSLISHIPTEKIPKTLPIVPSARDKVEELHFSETDAKPTTTSPLIYFGSIVENKKEENIMDSKANSSVLGPSSNAALENTNIVNNDLDTDGSLLNYDVLENDVDVEQPSINSSSISTRSGNFVRPNKNNNELDTFQGQVVGYYYENLTNDDILQLCRSPQSNSSFMFTDKCKDNWVYSPNDSYITWESIPESSDECFIFVDTENIASPTVICSDNSKSVPSKSELEVITQPKYSGDVTKEVISIPDRLVHTLAPLKINNSGEMPKIVQDIIPQLNLTDLTGGIMNYPADNAPRVLDNIRQITDSVSVVENTDSVILKSPLVPEYLNDSISNIVYNIGSLMTNESQNIVNYFKQESNIDENLLSAVNNTVDDIILYVEDMNSTLENLYVDVDETWASYTEIPYDSLVLYPEDENETWTANEDSAGTTQFLLDREKLSGLLNDIILNTN